jgi:dihydrolipoamide dehydrogenase
MFDLIILGGGPAGYFAAQRAADAGLQVCLFEERALGGVCLNEGCIPSKALLHSAKLFDEMNGGSESFGVTCENPLFDFPAAVRYKDKSVKSLTSGIEAALKARKVTVLREHGLIEGRRDEGFLVNGETGRNLLIASGSEPILPPIRGIEACLTNRALLSLQSVPRSLAIIGGGVVGLEMASVFRSAGSDVTVYEMQDRIAGEMDRDIADLLLKNYEKRGIVFKLAARVTDAAELGAETVLISVGRRAAVSNLGLDTLGVYVDKRAVVTDEQMKTNVPCVYAAGDCNGKSMLAHTAYREAEVAVNTILGKKDRMRYDAIPNVIYGNPEAAGCGETLASAAEKGIPAVEKKLSMRHSGRYAVENENGNGICKLVLHGDRVLGIHMLGNPASEIIAAAAVIIERQMTINQLLKVVFPHPTIGEIIRETALS